MNRDVTFNMKVLGRMLEHLGSQMYKRRDTALAELVANAWDAGATTVSLTIPTDGYEKATSEIHIVDNGLGMSETQVQNQYLVVGRNRREDGDDPPNDRKAMGRKGIGKLAGFGIAQTIDVTTTSGDETTTLALSLSNLKLDANEVNDVPISGSVRSAADTDAGTTIRLKGLKQKTPPDIEALRLSLGRRFSRVVHGEMEILVNGNRVEEPKIDFELRVPEDGWAEGKIGGQIVRYYYGFSNKVLKSPLLRGFALYANGKTAQAPPFFFNVEATASGQHGTRYMFGALEIDYLDQGRDDDSDLISTDRQEMDWEAEESQPLLEWGAALTRKALREWADRRSDDAEKSVLDDPAISSRIKRLDEPSRKQLTKAIRTLGNSEADPERLLELASSLVSAFEYRQFHDVTGQIEAIDDPSELETLLGHLTEWKVLESRAILEIVRGRIQIIDKFHKMLVNNAPETAPRKGDDNLHDLIASYPWLLNPEWQVLHEERTITAQLRDWLGNDVPDETERQRYDFLALEGPGQLIVVEIKRPGHAVTLEELQRLQTYRDKLRNGSPGEIRTALVSGPDWATDRTIWEDRPELDLLTWAEVHLRTAQYYEQYRAVLEADVEHRDFSEMEREISRTRDVVDAGSYRGPDVRGQGLGPQFHEKAAGDESNDTSN